MSYNNSIQKQENDFRMYIDHDKWAPVAFMDKFSIDFIRQMRDKLDLDQLWMKTSIAKRGVKFLEEIYGKGNI